MALNITREVAALRKLAGGELKQMYAEVCGEQARSGAGLMRVLRKSVEVVGVRGFEPPTSCSRSRRANRTALRPDSLSPYNYNSCLSIESLLTRSLS